MHNVAKFPVVPPVELPPILLPSHAELTAALEGGPAVTVLEATQHAIARCASMIAQAGLGKVSEDNLRKLRQQQCDLTQLLHFYASLIE